MILRSWGPQTAYRMHTPRWATDPISGAGAALHGGRANRKGLAALYLSLDTTTAVAEYQQLSSLMPPGTLVSYTVRLESVVDFSAGFEPAIWSPLWQDFGNDWRQLWFDERIEPPSWVLGDDVVAAGARGLLFRSLVAPTGLNLVVYPDALGPTDELTVYDPEGSLPKSQASWR